MRKDKSHMERRVKKGKSYLPVMLEGPPLLTDPKNSTQSPLRTGCKVVLLKEVLRANPVANLRVRISIL